ncbi:hypothetical protein TcG_13407 [Trypanosoma cruzi]|nr:hypothetical protein TcG_13407 [Trypanosoma cruzi]
MYPDGRNGAGRVCCSGSLPRAEVLRKREDRNHALRRVFTVPLEARVKQLGALSIPKPLIPRGMAAPLSCLLGSAVLRCCWDRVCALPPPQHLPDVSTATPCRRTSGSLKSSCPFLGRPARATQIASDFLFRWCCSSHTEETDRPDRLRNLHLACPRHLLVERRAAGQRRPAQSAAASSRPSTI